MEHRRDFVDRHHGLKVRKNGQQKTCNLSCNIAAKRVVQRCCAFYHQHKTCLATNQVFNRFERRLYNAQHHNSTRFAAVLRNTLHVFFFASFSVPLLRKKRFQCVVKPFPHVQIVGRKAKWQKLPGGKGLQFCSLFICLSVFFTKSKFLYPMTVESELLKHLTIKIYANFMNFWYFS